MDIRGIEVTNQLRSAIRAKLLELSVRYDEELPDYILVMVVNKKTRQQMHEDLHLFLEDSTTPFVEWLHDQVLKKLQKVTIAKKKVTREFVPTVVVKQEEERKKRKNNATAIGGSQGIPLDTCKSVPVITKEENAVPKVPEKELPLEKSLLEVNSLEISNAVSTVRETVELVPTKLNPPTTIVTTSIPSPEISKKPTEALSEQKPSEARAKMLSKRPLESAEHHTVKPEKRVKTISIFSEDHGITKKDEEEIEAEDNATRDERRLKSCINKPRLTSVVSIKNRLGIVSPRKKFEVHRARELDSRHRPFEKKFEKTVFDSNRFEKTNIESNRLEKNSFDKTNWRTNLHRGRSFEKEESPSWSRNESRNWQPSRANEGSNRLGNIRDSGRFGKNADTNEKSVNIRVRSSDQSVSNVKCRLGVNKKNDATKEMIVEEAISRGVKNTIKNRLGPFRNRTEKTNSHAGFTPAKKMSKDDSLDADDDDQVLMSVGPVKSHVIALKRPEPNESQTSKIVPNGVNDVDEKFEVDGSKSIASKVIVTPRPLKPLQPTQKRATQSLLLRAVAEANQSVVKQKNPEPLSSDKPPRLKLAKTSGTREIGKNLSVHLNATKRLVMEKIQVQLRTTDSEETEQNEEYTSRPVDDEHMDVVMSLFQRTDDKQKFLVTLNGYNNNVIKEKSFSDGEDGRLETEVTEDEEFASTNPQTDSYERNEPPLTSPMRIIAAEESEICEKMISYENNENHNSENVVALEEAIQRKRRKLSPIIYARAMSPSSAKHSAASLAISPAEAKETVEQSRVIEVPLSTIVDKTRDKCRYWPNCTLGINCAYYHPAVPCGSFPACKYGEKCAYKHPKCKFGLSCTKLGCVFSHPKQQCKYHPFCTKPTCPYTHPATHSTLPTEAIRAKFSWKRRD